MKERTWPRRLKGGLAWGAGAAVFGLGACVPLAGAGYLIDLASNLAAQAIIPGVLACLWLALRRNWGKLGLAGVGCALLAWPVVARPWTVRALPSSPTPPVRILVFNSSTTEGDPGAAMKLIEGVGADVVVLTEPSGDLLDRVRASALIAQRYPGYFLPDRAEGGYLLVLSVWPQSPVVGDAPRDVAQRGLRFMRIDRAEGPFVLLALHPDSPRSPAEWAKGNAVVEEVGTLLESGLLERGLPVVVAADMNSTPSGWRSRRLVSAGVRRAKPVLAGGTYPSSWPWPLRVAIDDLWLGPGGVLAGWSTPEGGGSDHLPVLVNVGIAGQAGASGGR